MLIYEIKAMLWCEGCYVYKFDDGSEYVLPEEHIELGTRVWDCCILMAKCFECGGIELSKFSKVLEIGCE